jgi:hypothetical protein
MRILEVIESKQWVNSETGATASIYGSLPWRSVTEKDQWAIVVRGFTWKNSNGTIGLGRRPAKTYAEALEVMEKFNNRGTQ